MLLSKSFRSVATLSSEDLDHPFSVVVLTEEAWRGFSLTPLGAALLPCTVVGYIITVLLSQSVSKG